MQKREVDLHNNQLSSTKDINFFCNKLQSLRTKFIKLQNLRDDIFIPQPHPPKNLKKDLQEPINLYKPYTAKLDGFENFIKLLNDTMVNHPRFSTQANCITHTKKSANFTKITLIYLINVLVNFFRSQLRLY